MKDSNVVAQMFSIWDRTFRTYTTPRQSAECYIHGPTGDVQRVLTVRVGDLVGYDQFWVSSDGPDEGYTHVISGQVTKIGPKTITIQRGGSPLRVKSQDFWMRQFQLLRGPDLT